MARKEVLSRENYLTRLAVISDKALTHFWKIFAPPSSRLMAGIVGELSCPDTADEFLSQGLRLSRNLTELAHPANPHDGEAGTALCKLGIEATITRLDAAVRLGRVLGVVELSAVDAALLHSTIPTNHLICVHELRILLDPKEFVLIPTDNRLSAAGHLAMHADTFDIRDQALDIAVNLLAEPAIDPFIKYRTASRLYSMGTRYFENEKIFDDGTVNKVGAFIPEIMDAMLASDAPKAADRIFKDCWQTYSDRGDMEPIADQYLNPKLEQISQYLGYNVSRLQYSFDKLPQTLDLPRPIQLVQLRT